METDGVVAKPTEPDHFLVWLTVDEIKQKLFLPHQVYGLKKYIEHIQNESFVGRAGSSFDLTMTFKYGKKQAITWLEQEVSKYGYCGVATP